MVEKKYKDNWRCNGKTVQGASHIRTSLPNQDAICWWPEFGLGPPLILAVSDGHGSAKSFRSHIGATLAVNLATKVLKQLFQLDEQPDQLNADISRINHTVQTQLPKKLVNRWQEAVENELEKEPFTDDEWALLEKEDGLAARQAVEKNPTIAYGATLLAVVVAEHFILYLQLGDGDILCVDTNGKTTYPIPRDEKLIANQTTSLCLPDAWREVRVRLVRYSENPPALILVSTDGYSNSFRSESDFLMIGQDYRQMIRSTGIERVHKQLTSILEESSQQGSGDDITLGIIKRIEKGDVDYVESALLVEAKAREQLQGQVEDRMTKHQEHISDVDSKLKNLDRRYNKLSKNVTWLRFWLYSLSATFFLTILAVGGVGLNLWPLSQIPLKKSTQPASSKAESPTARTSSLSDQKPDYTNKPEDSHSAAQKHN